MTVIDDELTLEFPRYPAILSYSSLESDRVCQARMGRLRHEAKRAEEQSDALPLNLPLAMLRAITIGSGVLVGYSTTRRD